MTEKVIDKLKDKKFVEKIIGLQTEEEVIRAFSEEGVDIAPEELEELGKYIDSAKSKLETLSEEEIKSVSGGDNITSKVLGPVNGFFEMCGLLSDNAEDAAIATAIATGIVVWEVGKAAYRKGKTWWRNRKSKNEN